MAHARGKQKRERERKKTNRKLQRERHAKITKSENTINETG